MLPIIEAAAKKCGTVAELARKIEAPRTALYAWSRVPAEYVLKIEKVTGISRNRLRPDLYPRERGKAA